MYRRILFVDIDGVLNNEAFFAKRRTTEPGNRRSDSIDPENVLNLRGLVMMTGAKIVISSSWRHGDDWLERLQDVFLRAGWSEPPIIGRTPALCNMPRGQEIQAWLEQHSAESYFILDDETDMLPEQQERLLRCDPKTGLTAKDAVHVLCVWDD